MINVQLFGKPPIGPLTGPQLQSQLAIRLSDPSEGDNITTTVQGFVDYFEVEEVRKQNKRSVQERKESTDQLF